VGIKLFDLHEGGNIGDSKDCFLEPTDLTYDSVLILCLLNKPAIEQDTAFPTERNLHGAITDAIANIREAGAPVPRYVLIIEADEEVSGEIVTFTKGEGFTADGQTEYVWVPHPNAYKWMCIRENTLEKQLNSPGSTPDYNFGGGESNF